MADLEDVQRYALNQMQKWDLNDWSFFFDTAIKRFGLCSRKKKLISLSRKLTLLNSASDAYDCVRHEIAHALSPPKSGHNAIWKQWALKVGADPSRTYGEHIQQPPRPWKGICPQCKQEIFRYRRKKIACGKCSRQAGKRFDSRFLFQWFRINPIWKYDLGSPKINLNFKKKLQRLAEARVLQTFLRFENIETISSITKYSISEILDLLDELHDFESF